MTDEKMTMADAIQLIGSLKPGTLVRVTREGRTVVLPVTQGPRRADGAFGSPESTRVTVSYPKGYAFEVAADHLVRTRRGHGWIGGGTTLEVVDDDVCVVVPEEFPEHDYDAAGECRRCGAEADA